jgi:hypothetical protein
MAPKKINAIDDESGVCVRNVGEKTKKSRGGNRENMDEFASYAFDILQSLRESSTQERHRFLSYLIGLAAEEAIRLAEGQQSAAAQYGTKTSAPNNPV